MSLDRCDDLGAFTMCWRSVTLMATTTAIWWSVLPVPSASAEGIASKYPGDDGIERDSKVVFVETFEVESIRELSGRWESIKDKELMSLSETVPAASADGKSLLMTHVGGQGNGAHLYRRLDAGYDKLYVRFYVRFESDCAPIHHFFHVGGYHPATSWPQGGAGTRPRGNERFSTGVEPFGEKWQWDFYSYWMEMRGSPPRGQCWGNSFIHDPSLRVKRDEWQCLELMMKMNEVGDSNGEMALWVDGKLAAHLGKGFPSGKWIFDKFKPGQGGDGIRWSDEIRAPNAIPYPNGGRPFEGFRWRSDEELKINFLWVLLYITKAPPGHVSKIWFDNIVVAKDYIGPIEARETPN